MDAEDTTREAAPDARLPPVQLSDEWGQFRLLEALGEGSYGRVYRAWDPELQRQVAVKILHRRVDDTRHKERLLGEGRALARVRHPHVVEVHTVVSHQDQVALCMEFIAGETLEQALASQGPMNAREAALVGEDICQALSAVHRAGYVHRDVKTRNVMREQGGRIVLMDFGTGRDTTRLDGAVDDLVGTPVYMAPEVLDGERASPASDVYSVGVMLYRLVTYEYPVAGYTASEVRQAHHDGRRHRLSERRPDLPQPFIRVVERALAPDPQQRFVSAAALLDALATLHSGKRARVLARAAIAVGGGIVAVGFLGLMTTEWFNLTTGRSGAFSAESPTVWLEMGLRSLVTPILYMALALLAFMTVQFIVRVVRLVPAVDRQLIRAGEGLALTARLNLNDPHAFSQAVATLGIIVLVAVVWGFADVFQAYTTITISDAPTAHLLPLRWDESRVGPSLSRALLDVLALALIAALVRIRRLCARQPRARRAAIVPVAILLALTVLLIELPFRLGWRAYAERVDLAGRRCYMLGSDGIEALLYCPDNAPPRNTVTRLDHPAVRRLGTIENIFTSP